MIYIDLNPNEKRRLRRCEASRRYYARNKGSCVLKGQKWKRENHAAVVAANEARKTERAARRALREQDEAPKRLVRPLLWSARRRAKRKGIQFDIGIGDLLPVPTHCPVLGLELAYGPGRGRKLYDNGSAASLDRADNSKGYTKDNVLIVSLRANLLKGQATVEELRKIAAFYDRRLS